MYLKSLLENGFPIGEKPGRIPFTHTLGTDSFRDPMTSKRLAETLRIIEEFDPPILDISGPNIFSQEIGKVLSEKTGRELKVENTLECDFNDGILAPGSRYRTIMCFEVIEHVMNPLNVMRDIFRLLEPGGVVYISTPRMPLISIYSSTFHFTEYKESKIEILFRWAGFEVEKKKKFNVFPWWIPFTGFRPLWRFTFQRLVVFKLRKPRNS